MKQFCANSTTKKGGNIRTEDIRERSHPTKHRRLNELRDTEAVNQINDYKQNKDKDYELPEKY